MLYHDSLYGAWELPPIIAKLMRTKTARRMRCITQSVFPNELVLHGPIPSRCQHGLGVAFLMQQVIKNNPGLSAHECTLLMVAAFLHDAGNPPFTHLAEPFLKKLLGHDGETYLCVVLSEDPEALNILAEHGIGLDELIDTVSGKTELSTILHGTMDVDNLDNVWRYAMAARLGVPLFHPAEIASSFRWHEGAWHLMETMWQLVLLWQDARAIVYAKVYDVVGFPPHVMLHRALDLAFSENALATDFFLKNDNEAIDILLACPVREVRELVSDMMLYRWFEPVFSVETTEPSDMLKSLVEIKNSRTALANEIAEAIPSIREENVAVHVGKGRDHRAVTLPLIREGNRVHAPKPEFKPIYRCRVFVAHGTEPSERASVRDYAAHMTEHQNQLT